MADLQERLELVFMVGGAIIFGIIGLSLAAILLRLAICFWGASCK